MTVLYLTKLGPLEVDCIVKNILKVTNHKRNINIVSNPETFQANHCIHIFNTDQALNLSSVTNWTD